MRRYLTWALVVGALLLYLFGSSLITLFTDLLWFTEVGYRPVLLTLLRTQVMLAVVLGAAFFLLVYANLWIARRWAPPVPRLYTEYTPGERIGEFARRTVDVLLFVGSLVAALIAGLEASSHWQEYLLWTHPARFGVTDPLFHRDIGFYIFRLPFILYLYRWLLFTLIVSFLATAWVHWSDRALQFAANHPVPRFAPHVKVHLSALLSLLLFTLAFGYWLKRYNLLQSDFGLVALNGAGYTDTHARLLGLTLMAFGSAAVGVLMLANLGLRGLNAPAYGLAGLFALSLVVGVFYPAFMQTYIVAPSDVKLEQPYIGYNIDFTRRAYGMDRFDEQNYNADASMTAQTFKEHQASVQNVRLWDYSVLGRVYLQQQGLRPYYDFTDVDVDRYFFPNGYRQVMLAAREFKLENAPQKTWVSQRLQYTHGYGAVMNAVSEVTDEGSPAYLLKDMPPRPAPGLEQALKLDRPQVYFGTADNGYAIVNAEQPEFDFPSTGGDKTTEYSGTGGISIGSYGRKLLFSTRFGEPNFVLSKLIGSGAKVLMHRQIQERVGTLAPFLYQDPDPYLTLVDGRLVWILDCYTVTDQYPYSQPSQINVQDYLWVNYMRNSVKVTVDAYDGTTNFYVFDKSDPMIQAYQRIFPALFKPVEQFPKSLLAHIRYPERLFDLQSRLFTRYHMKNPRDFYTQSDAWDLAKEGTTTNTAEEAPPMQPYYVTMKLPDSDKPEFILIRPFTPLKKANLTAWMAVRCDPENYGKTVIYEFPKSSLTEGPEQIEVRIQQDPEISKSVSLWNTQGSHINWGNLLVIPFGHALLYVQPLYLEAAQGPAKMPELKQVIVATDQPQRVVMRPTLREALSEIMGADISTGPETPTGPTPTTLTGGKPAAPGAAALVRRANVAMTAAEAAQRAGDWAGYGKALNDLKQALRALQTQVR